MIERPTNDEAYRRMRGEVLDQLKEKFRRARSECPCVSPDDIAYIRNVVRPALDQTKIGSAGKDFLAAGSLLPLLKQADLWGDIKSNVGSGWDYLKSQAGEAADQFSQLSNPLTNFSRGGVGGVIGGISDTFKAIGAPFKGLYNLGQGVIGGGLATASPEALEWSKQNLKGVDRAAEWLAGEAPWALIPGGLALRAGKSLAAPVLKGLATSAVMQSGMPLVTPVIGSAVSMVQNPNNPGQALDVLKTVKDVKGSDFSLPWNVKEPEAPQAPSEQPVPQNPLNYNFGAGPNPVLQNFLRNASRVT